MGNTISVDKRLTIVDQKNSGMDNEINII